MKIKIKSYCKINLFLKILKKLKVGLHDIQTYTSLLDLHDDIEISETKKKKDIIIFKGKFKNFVNKSKNSVLDTLSGLRSRKLINLKKNFRIIIEKRIPVFSGLGGGSSNAAYITKYLTKNNMKQSDMRFFENKIGTDFSLFFNKQSFVINLKKIKKYENNFTLNFVLIFPNIRCSTKKIYSQVKNFSPSSNINFSKIKTKNKFIDIIRKERNDLEKTAIQIYPTLKVLKENLQILPKVKFVRMTGSGSAFVAYFLSKKDATNAHKIFRKKYKNYWSIISKTI